MEQQDVIIEETEQPGIWYCRYDGFQHKILQKNDKLLIWRRGDFGYGAEVWDIARTMDEVRDKIRNAYQRYRRTNA